MSHSAAFTATYQAVLAVNLIITIISGLVVVLRIKVMNKRLWKRKKGSWLGTPDAFELLFIAVFQLAFCMTLSYPPPCRGGNLKSFFLDCDVFAVCFLHSVIILAAPKTPARDFFLNVFFALPPFIGSRIIVFYWIEL